MATETYSVAGDTLNGIVSESRLAIEIDDDPGILVALDLIERRGDVLDLIFASALPAPEKTALDAVVAAHDGAAPDVVADHDIKGAKTATFGDAPIQNMVPGSTPTVDWRLGQKCEMTLSTTVTSITFIDPPGIGNFMLTVKQPAGANHPINAGAWAANVKTPGGAAPVITPVNGAVDELAFYFDGTDYYLTFSQDHKAIGA